MRRPATIVSLVAALAACGTVDNPDLQHGAVTGRIPNATAGAYAYVLGAPELLATAASDGTFRLDRVPSGPLNVVLFDGASGAETVQVQVSGASIGHVDPGRPLRVAAALTVAASPLSGTLPAGLSFTVDGTPLRQIVAASGAARLFPLPAGTFSVTATQPGFQDERMDVSLGEGDDGALEFGRRVDLGDDRRGCLSCGCDKGLACSADDGLCYECVTDAQCGPGGRCTSGHVCSRPAGAGLLCDACTGPSDCGSGLCVNPTGGSLTGTCSSACSGTQDCPSGFDCRGNACTPQSTCLLVTATYGAACTEDTNCAAALKDGKCAPLDRPSGTPGYCSARVQAACPPGFTPDPRGTGYCVRSS